MPYISDEELRKLTGGQQQGGDLGRLAALQEMQGAQPVPIPLPAQPGQEAPPDTTGVDVGSGLLAAGVGTAMMFNPLTMPFAPLAMAAVGTGAQAGGRAAIGAGQDPVGAANRLGGAAVQTAGKYGKQQAGIEEKRALRERRKLDIEEQRMRIRQEVERVDAQRQSGVDVPTGIGSMVKNAPKRQEEPYVSSGTFNQTADTSLSDPGSVISGIREVLASGTAPADRVGELMRMEEELKRRFPGMGSRSGVG